MEPSDAELVLAGDADALERELPSHRARVGETADLPGEWRRLSPQLVRAI